MKIISLLREVHLLALTEIERLNLRITELENEKRQLASPEIAKPAEKVLPAIRPESNSKPPEMMNEHEVAALLKMSVASVRRWRQFRIGPKFVKIGAAVRYRRRDVDTWLNSCAATANGK